MGTEHMAGYGLPVSGLFGGVGWVEIVQTAAASEPGADSVIFRGSVPVALSEADLDLTWGVALETHPASLELDLSEGWKDELFLLFGI